MTPPFSQIQVAHQRLLDALNVIPNMRLADAVVAPVTAPQIIVGAPRFRWAGYGTSFSGQPITGQWVIYYVVPLNQYAVENLLSTVASICNAIERFTPGVVTSAGPGSYPSPTGLLPAYLIHASLEVVMA